MTESWSLQGRTALVCGASGGIGEATARLLAARGARVLAVARNQEKLQALIKALPGEGHRFFSVDLSDTDKLQNEIVPLVRNESVQILVNNSGGPKGGLLYKADIKEFTEPLKAHLLASHLLVQAVLPAMQKASYGRIVNVISTSVKTPLPNLGVSNTVRAAMANWSKTLAMELAPFGITVNNVLPGYIETGRLQSLMQTSASATGQDVSIVKESWQQSVPMARIGKPSEMAEAIAFLASPAASYITGVNLPVDGGRTPSL